MMAAGRLLLPCAAAPPPASRGECADVELSGLFGSEGASPIALLAGRETRAARPGLTRVTVARVAVLASAALLAAACLRPRHPAARAQQPPAAAVVDDAVRLDAAAALGVPLASLKPLEPMHDGNVCGFDEELFAGLCYKKCALLTSGAAPIRTTSWTCCEGHPCTPLNERGRMGVTVMCTGFDISGDGSCPHKPGVCLLNEELFGGICYEKCSLLTHGAFAHRVAPATCCDAHGLSCLMPNHDRTSKDFAVGGGAGDHDPSTPAEAHLPQVSLAEDSTAPVVHETLPVAEADVPLVTDLRPLETMHDGNVCGDNEELYGGLCYGKCSVLTHGRAHIRTSSWTCCTAHPCFPWKLLGSVGTTLLCNGYDVSGDGSCPHKPGACLVDEELHMGLCYKRCILLTRGAFPHRFGAATCCKTEGLGCLDVRNDKTSQDFDVGGGAGDHDASTPAQAHPPQLRLTETAEAPEEAMKATKVSTDAGAAVNASAPQPQERRRPTFGDALPPPDAAATAAAVAAGDSDDVIFPRRLRAA